MMPYAPNPDRFYGLEPREADYSDEPEQNEDEINERISGLLAPVRDMIMDLFVSLPSESRRLDVMLLLNMPTVRGTGEDDRVKL